MNKKLKAKIIEVYGSQTDFSEVLGIDESLISRIVRNRRELDQKEKQRWAIALKCQPDEIFKTAQ